MLNLLYLDCMGVTSVYFFFQLRSFFFKQQLLRLTIHFEELSTFFKAHNALLKYLQILLRKINQQEVRDHGLCTLNYSEHRGQNRKSKTNIRESTIHNAQKTIIK